MEILGYRVTTAKPPLDKAFKVCKSSKMEPFRKKRMNLRYFKFGISRVAPNMKNVTEVEGREI